MLNNEELVLAPGVATLQTGQTGCVVSPDGDSWDIPAPVLDFLLSFERSSALESRISEWREHRPLASPPADVLRVAASAALSHGILWNAPQLLTRWSHREHAPGGGVVPLLFVPTRNRAASCAQTVDDFLENILQHGHATKITVVDTSSDPATAAEYDARLRLVAQRHSQPVNYAGRREIPLFITALCEESGVDRTTAAEMLTDALAPGEGRAYGAVRNLLLLMDPGGLHAAVDDDVLCRGADTRTSPLSEFQTERSRAQLSFHRDWSALLHGRELSRPDFFKLAAPLLGSHPASWIRQGSITLETSPSRLAASFRKGSRIRWVYPGSWGDCGHNTNVVYFHRHNRSIWDYLRQADQFDLAMTARLYQLDFPTTIAGRGFYSAGRAYWLDHRGIVPPYLPILRGEDYVQNHFMELLDPSSLTAYVPFSLLHRPTPERPPFTGFYENHHNHESAHGFTQYLLSWMREADAAWQDAPPEIKMAKTASLFCAYGAWPAEAFQEMAVHTGRCLMENQLHALESLLASDGRMADAVRERWLWLREQYRRKIFQPEELVPPDCPSRHVGQDWHATQLLLGRFGRYLQAWPALREAAPRLAQDSDRFFQRLS